jgi:hypothetical protein
MYIHYAYVCGPFRKDPYYNFVCTYSIMQTQPTIVGVKSSLYGLYNGIYILRTEKQLYCTVDSQSKALVCQNLVNYRRNISAYRRRRNLRVFLFKRSWAGE